MKFSEEQVKDIVTLKESLIGEIDKHNESIEMLEKNIKVLDLFLKDSSFTKASQMGTKAEIQDKTENTEIQDKTENTEIQDKTENTEKPKASSIPIKRVSDGKVIANAYVTAEQLSIVLDDEITISEDTPPFKSYFLDRIIGEMRNSDFREAENGKIKKESIIDYTIKKNGVSIKEIIIKNYRQKERVDELINTAEWSLTRMLEKIKE